MKFNELKMIPPLKDEKTLFEFLESAFDFRIENKEYSGELATLIYNEVVGYLDSSNYICDENDKESIYYFVNLFMKLDYIPRKDTLTDAEYQIVVDSAWKEPYEYFLKMKEKRAP